MVSANRYLKHHEDEAEQIEITLNQFGYSGEVSGFWCIKGSHISIFECIGKCEHANYCHNTPPPQKQIYDSLNPYRGDMALRFLMSDRPLGNREDWIWLQHPETRNSTSKRRVK